MASDNGIGLIAAKESGSPRNLRSVYSGGREKLKASFLSRGQCAVAEVERGLRGKET